MGRTKAFFISLIFGCSVMLCGFAGLYWIISYSAAPAVDSQGGVPILTVQPQDTKTCLAVLDFEDTDFFMIINFNALQKEVNAACVPGSFYLEAAGRTLHDSMKYAGVMQCVEDISKEFDLKINHYLVADEESLVEILSSFNGFYPSGWIIPQSAKEFLLKGSDYIEPDTLALAISRAAGALDNQTGIEFLNIAALQLIKDNMHNIRDYALDDIRKSFSSLSTDMSTEDFDRLKRICNFLLQNPTDYHRLVLSDSETAQSEIDKMFKE